MTTVPAPRAESTGIARWQTPALAAGIVGVVLSVIGVFVSPVEFFRAYVTSWLFWFTIAAGSVGVMCLQYITGGEWGLMIRRPLGAASRSVWVLAVLIIPFIFAMKKIFFWADPSWPKFHEIQEQKGFYLNPTAFWVRNAVYFAFLLIWAWRIRVLSLEFYKTRSPFTELSRRKWAAAGLVLIVLVLTFFSIDWLMSPQPEWSSTMFGITFTIGCGLSAFAFVTFFLSRLARTAAMEGVLKPMHLRDLGNLLLTFVMLYAYTSFSEFLLIWYANLHEEIPYFISREHGTWGAIALIVVVFHFFLPFFLLLMRGIKDRPETIGGVTIVILIVRYIAIYWLAAPAWYPEQFHYHWTALTTLVGIGGLWIFEFIRQLKGQTIIPIHETWVEEAIREGALKVNA